MVYGAANKLKALILAAGEGRRMRPLTLNCPKPLLDVGGKSLLEYHLDRLHQIDVDEAIINLAYLGDQIRNKIGDSYKGLPVKYSTEPEPLETGGAIFHARSLLGSDPFLLINGDVWCEFPVADLVVKPLQNIYARLVLVDNPDHNPFGDFVLGQNAQLSWASKQHQSSTALTYAGVGLVSPDLVMQYPQARQKFPLREAFSWAIEKHALEGVYYSGQWCDVGTPQRLEDLRQQIAQK